MSTKMTKSALRLRRQRRVRAKVQGSATRPRLSVFRSARHVYAQIIDDAAGATLVASNDLMIKDKDKVKIKKEKGRTVKRNVAYAVGKMVAEAAQKKGVTEVVFDRNGFTYTGRVKALAEGARDAGLKF